MSVARLHETIDERAGRLAAHHGERLRCRRGCSSCCVDEIRVSAVEADAIREAFPELLASARPHPEGACAFLDEAGACRIYARRPYVCRTQGLPLRWLESRGDETVELRDICPLNEPDGPPIETLPADACWTIGPVEAELARLDDARGGGARVRLRSLFADGSR